MMSPAQVSAAAVTFGRRHSLLCVLGLWPTRTTTTAGPTPRPPRPPTRAQPKVPTRDQRNAPRVSVDTLNGLFDGVAGEAGGNAGGTLADFASWAKVTLGTECDLSKPSNWDEDVSRS
jgi:hypothetical protein